MFAFAHSYDCNQWCVAMAITDSLLSHSNPGFELVVESNGEQVVAVDIKRSVINFVDYVVVGMK